MCSKVSVIVPAFNREAFIRQTVDSVLSQTHDDVELIVVDDGSTDGTREILDSYGDQLILLNHPGGVNRGQSASINLGLRSASGVYVSILDSDDFWNPDKLKKQALFLDANPDLGLVYSNGQAVDGEGRFLYDIYTEDHIENNNPSDVLLDCYFFVPTNTMFRRNVLDKSGYFDESLRSAQDHDMAIRLVEVCKAGYIPEKLFYYRRHEDSISHRKAEIRWNNGFVILSKARSRYHYPLSVVRKRKAVLHFRLFQCLRERNKVLKSIWHLLLAGIYDPVRAIKVLLSREGISSPH